MAIQPASPLNAYLTGASSAPLTPESDEGAVAQGGASAGRSQAQHAAREAPTETVQTADSQPNDMSAEDTPSAQTVVSAMYGSNARSVAARTAGPSVTYYA